MPEDVSIVERVLCGDVDAFGLLVNKYQRLVTSVVFNMTGDTHLSQDVAQDVFIAAYKKLASFDACRAKFSTFVGRDYDSSVLDITALYPSTDSWRLQEDREVVCAVYDMNGEKLTGSARGSSL